MGNLARPLHYVWALWLTRRTISPQTSEHALRKRQLGRSRRMC